MNPDYSMCARCGMLNHAGYCQLTACMYPASVTKPAPVESHKPANYDHNLVNCDYCHEDGDGAIRPFDKNGHAYLSFSDFDKPKLVLRFGKERREVEIYHCPICGRRLRK